MSENDKEVNVTTIPLFEGKLPVYISDIEMDDDGLMTFDMTYDSDVSEKIGKSKPEVEKEVENFMISALETMVNRDKEDVV